MSASRVFTRTLSGINAISVTVEAHLGGGLPAISIVGMPETAVKESRDRVKAAIVNSRFVYPTQKIVINLAPADLPKQGGRFDLPIALSILVASGQLPAQLLDNVECVGELALSGDLRAVKGILPTAIVCGREGKRLLLPCDNLAEATLSENTELLSASSLTNVVALLHKPETEQLKRPVAASTLNNYTTDMADVQGQYVVKRALEIAAAGGHNLLLSGPPGTGKSMLATRLPTILPTMTPDEAIESAMIASISHAGFKLSNWFRRPFRSPHHTASGVALVGGGSPPRPGEISLAHHGVLFLDELPEFSRSVLDVLREPMETGQITISRASQQAEFPACFQIVAAMNPCPCGYDGDQQIQCRCTPDQIKRYQSRISGPFLDRIDLFVPVPRLSYQALREQTNDGETSRVIRDRVEACRTKQLQRQLCANANLESEQIKTHCTLSKANNTFIDSVSDKLQLSLRAHVRVLRIARTIADLDHSRSIEKEHIVEAISYRYKGSY